MPPQGKTSQNQSENQQTTQGKKPLKPAAIGTQWAVLSVLLLWLISAFSSELFLRGRLVPAATLAVVLLGTYILAIGIPGLILVRTSFSHYSAKMISRMAFTVAIPLTILRFLEMGIERSACGAECAGSLPLIIELLLSMALPFILAWVMYLIARSAGHSPKV